MAKKTNSEETKEKNDDPLHEARERYKKSSEYWQAEKEAMLDDIRFRAGQQWPDEIYKERIREKRPCLTVDRINQYIRQIVNDGRQNRPAIKVRPVDSGADVATAEVFQGIIRHIEDRSNADTAYDTALDCASTAGVGYFRVLTEYVGDDSFDQELVIRRMRDPLKVTTDHMFQEADGSDMRYCFIESEMDKEDFEEKYPDFAIDSWDSSRSVYGDWFGDKIRIAEYWYVEEETIKLHRTTDGFIIKDEDLDMFKAQGFEPTLVETREIPQRKVYSCLMTGKDYLEEPKLWPGKWIPVLMVQGNETEVEGEVMRCGIVRPAKDSQRLYNYSRSAFAERVALTPKAPWVAAEGQVDKYENEWATANSANHSVLHYTPTSLNGTPVPPPMRQSAADIPAGFAQDMQISDRDIQSAIGMYNASLGAPSNERSGKAIMARQKEGDVGTFHYHDNQNRAIRHCGRILVDLIPKIYDSSRVVRIIGYDGTVGSASIDPNAPKSSQKQGLQMIYNLGVGNYDVSVSTGPSYNTLRMEKSQAMLEMVQANPGLMQIAGDLIVKAQDWPGAEEFAERLALTLPPEIQKSIADKKKGGLPPEASQMIEQMQQALEQKDQMIQQAADHIEQMQREMAKLKTNVDSKKDKVIIDAVQAEIAAFDSETRRLQVISESMTPEQIQQVVIQTLNDIAQLNAEQYPQPQFQPEVMPMEGAANIPPQGMEPPMESPPQ